MREIAISVYLLVFKLLFNIFKFLPLKNKVAFLVSFINNPKYIYDEMQKQNIDVTPIFLCKSPDIKSFYKQTSYAYIIESKNIIQITKSIYHLATSQYIIADNYYGFLAVTKFKESVFCTQVWHAAGAIKQFGAMNPSNINRTPTAIKRFHKVYSRFNQFVVGSDLMGDIFKKAMPSPNALILKTGIPFTDFYFDENKHMDIKKLYFATNPSFRGKKIILYAPTFREDEGIPLIPLDLGKMYASLKKEHVLLVKTHPASKWELPKDNDYSDFVFDYSYQHSIDELLLIADILITDYSSLPMEFVFQRKKMIFYPYDLEDYRSKTGFWEDYESSVPGPVVRNTTEVIEALLDQSFDRSLLDDFAKKWVSYCDGNSSERLVKILFT